MLENKISVVYFDWNVKSLIVVSKKVFNLPIILIPAIPVGSTYHASSSYQIVF